MVCRAYPQPCTHPRDREPIGAGSILDFRTERDRPSTPERRQRHTEPRYVRLGRHPESATLQV
eukprot:5143034-Prymnesium_polylepis.1